MSHREGFDDNEAIRDSFHQHEPGSNVVLTFGAATYLVVGIAGLPCAGYYFAAFVTCDILGCGKSSWVYSQSPTRASAVLKEYCLSA